MKKRIKLGAKLFGASMFCTVAAVAAMFGVMEVLRCL